MQTEEVRRILREGAAHPSRAVDVGRILRDGRRLRRARSFSTAALVVAVAFGAATVAANLVGVDRPNQPSGDPVRPAVFPEGWTRLPTPPEVRAGASLVWAGSEVLSWGGCDPDVGDACVPTADGYAFDVRSRTWERIGEAGAGGSYAEAVWTGREAIFFGVGDEERLVGQAYDPAAGAWRTIEVAPIASRAGRVAVWTGSEVVVWGGGRRDEATAVEGAAYDPASDSWRTIADAPLRLNLLSGMWTGREVLVFGSLLDDRNIAATDTSVGAAYDPASNTWRELPSSGLSPQATSAVWAGDRMVAWDYEVHSQTFDPVRDAWSHPIKMPLEFSECYPDSAVVNDLVFGFFCGQAALYDSETWTEISGGPLDEEVYSEGYRRTVKVWRFADLVSTGDTLFFLGEGITLDDSGEACYGCEGSPHSFWAYRPAP